MFMFHGNNSFHLFPIYCLWYELQWVCIWVFGLYNSIHKYYLLFRKLLSSKHNLYSSCAIYEVGFFSHCYFPIYLYVLHTCTLLHLPHNNFLFSSGNWGLRRTTWKEKTHLAFHANFSYLFKLIGFAKRKWSSPSPIR